MDQTKWVMKGTLSQSSFHQLFGKVFSQLMGKTPIKWYNKDLVQQIGIICDQTWVNEADVIRAGAKLWFCCQSILMKTGIILPQKLSTNHFPFQRYERNKLGMLEVCEFKNPCF